MCQRSTNVDLRLSSLAQVLVQKDISTAVAPLMVIPTWNVVLDNEKKHCSGHCGPKNDLQDQDIYCGKGCQSRFGSCNQMKRPSRPKSTPRIVNSGEKCGPIVNARCAQGKSALCINRAVAL